ncbi:Release factor glutamine methyltransferase [Botrimarina colliarenosi]|uniref:Release factor glutamine methyltransferase n=1 Tax=Botrimarina colliarenosi TaxID=2528001 RepID=A0A5C6AI11_9BACT|nr:methyltransferase domain-containing protein [Botrimarina colliarenosi]TWT99634.1 Release factor glutamine methyltransferase [Botrimarina colliarenosi]
MKSDSPRRLRILLLGVTFGALATLAARQIVTHLAPEPAPKVAASQDDTPPAKVWPPAELRADPNWQLLRYDAEGWSTQYVGTYKNLGEYLGPPPAGVTQLAIPILPTVYQPDIQDKLYYDAIAQGEIAEGDKVLVIGAGSGADSWAVSLKTRAKVYAVDINPLAVMNAQVTARLGGFEIEAVVGDFQEIELPDTFRDFDYVLWNMPFVEAGATAENFQDRNFYDGDDGTVATRFLKRLPSLLKPDGRAIALNYALAKRYLTTPGTETRVASGDDPADPLTYMLFVIPNPATAAAAD